MGEYLPRVHYMTKAQFEALGAKPRADTVPVWRVLAGNG
jgi:hypothetical protein